MSSTHGARTGRSPSVAVVIPVHDNEETLEQVAMRSLEALRRAGFALSDLLFVDDGSTDGSWDELRRLARTQDGVRAIRLARNVGNLSARSIGAEYVNAPVVCTLDADLDVAPEELPRLVREVHAGADLVSAVRRRRGRRPVSRRAGSILVRRLVKGRVNLSPSDFGCGMKAFSRGLLVTANRRCGSERGLRWAVEVFRASERYVEVPVVGSSDPSSNHSLLRGLAMVVALERALRGSASDSPRGWSSQDLVVEHVGCTVAERAV